MNNWNWHGWGHGFGWIFWTTLVVVMLWIVFKNSSIRRPYDKNEDSAMEILKKRYASGEISKEEFEEAKKTLQE